MSSHANQKWDRYDAKIAAEIVAVHNQKVPHIRLMLAIMLQAAIDKDYDYININNPLFLRHCRFAELPPADALTYFMSL